MKYLIISIFLFTTLLPSVSYAASQDEEMYVGETRTFNLPSSITSLTLKSVNFYSTSINYVEVVSNTNYSVTVKALKKYSSPIIVRCDYYYYVSNGGYTYQTSGFYDFNITVSEQKIVPTSITTPTVKAVHVGETVTITPTIEPANAEYTLTWKITNTSIATVSDGMVTGVSAGETDLKVTTDNGLYSMCRIVVTKPSATSVSLFPSDISLEIGGYQWLDARVTPSTADYTLSWDSDDDDVATVSSAGKVTAVGTGSTTITVTTNNGKSATCTVTVKQPTYSLTIDKEMSTFSYVKGLDFSGITDFKAYVASEYDEGTNSVSFTPVSEVAGKTGLLIVGKPGKYTIPVTNADAPSTNYLVAAIVLTQITPNYGGYTNYILTNGSHGVAFYAVSEEGCVPANRAYLHLPSSGNQARSVNMVFEDETNQIKTVMDVEKDNNFWHTLSGVPLSTTPQQHGIYINHRKKVIIK